MIRSALEDRELKQVWTSSVTHRLCFFSLYLGIDLQIWKFVVSSQSGKLASRELQNCMQIWSMGEFSMFYGNNELKVGGAPTDI